jgi:D-serine deaminase-like pyridoxal phosphate-dependent protein
MELRLENYAVAEASEILTPALLIYPDIVDANIAATVRLAGGDPDRWRPHIKTVKSAAVLSRLAAQGVVNYKCSTTLELLLACRNGAADVVFAFSLVGANASRAAEIAKEFPGTRVSVLIETPEMIPFWMKQGIGMFIDVNPGMDRTGVSQERVDQVTALVQAAGAGFRGLHYYDGHISTPDYAEREKRAHEGYDHLMRIVGRLAELGIPVGEMITSGTPAAPCAMSYQGFRNTTFIHRISPGTVVFNDLNSLKQLPGYGYAPAALVLATVVSQPTANVITCDAGHKGVSVDSGVPNCSVVGYPGLNPLKPSEEHLPIEIAPGAKAPKIGDQLYLVPKHVCPSVNNFDDALFIVNGRIRSVEPIGARGHEHSIAAAAV